MARGRDATAWPAGTAGAGVPRRRECVHGVEIDSESVLYDESSGLLHFLNWSASAVWWSIDGIASADALAADLEAAFGASGAAIADDVLRLLAMFASQHLIERVPARAGRAEHV